jgi:hypothetical protein
MRRLSLIACLVVVGFLTAADPPTLRKTSAAQVAPANLVLIEASTVAVVVERGQPPADAQDQTPTVRVLVLRPQATSAYKAGDVAVLGGVETVIDLGPLAVGLTRPVVVGGGN